MTATATRLLDPNVLARLGTLELVARTVVDGLITGLHRSPHFGFSQEFAEYRAYNEGDDLRFVDWNVYARTDRTYVKRFRGETNTAVMLLFDCSASMNFGEPVSKLDVARWLAASLAYLVRRQHDALGLAVFDETIRAVQPPSARPDSLIRTLVELERSEQGSGTDIVGAIDVLARQLRRRGLVLLVSDLYADVEALARALEPLAHAGHELAVFHVLDRQELEPDVDTVSRLRDIETDETVIVDPRFLADGYRRRFEEHLEALQRACRRLGADYIRVLSDEPLDRALLDYLNFRARRSP